MFQNRAEAFALVLPAAIFAGAIFLVPVVILLSEGFRSGDSWTIQAYIDFFAQPLNQAVFLR
ncbi:MAG TPA: spermidine/putrescine ABC transporter permease, partial [Thalassospira lucentensis]|nr:spermidine/putrescine ABC transporter permease [Thalassospira lucentensis]